VTSSTRTIASITDVSDFSLTTDKLVICLLFHSVFSASGTWHGLSSGLSRGNHITWSSCKTHQRSTF